MRVVSDHLSLIQKSWCANLKVEKRSNTASSQTKCPVTKDPLKHHDLVFYKRSLDENGHRPSKIVVVDGKVAFVHNGHKILRTHESDMQHVRRKSKTTVSHDKNAAITIARADKYRKYEINDDHKATASN